ncbi:MAG: sulfatase [Kiritimatiellae bacterium]|nr:sulfatase [Kiritimatiellia bacterium]
MPRLLCALPASPAKPNIVLINIDDLGWTDLGCFGSRYYETPNIDRLAAAGMKFTDAYAACAVCSPTRAAIMTGHYPARLGVTDWIRGKKDTTGRHPTEYVGASHNRLLCPPNHFWLDLDEATIAELLKTVGYATCHIGKWHLGGEAHYPDKQGFDVNLGGCHYGQPPSYFDPYRRGASRAGIPGLPPRKEGEYLTDREADEAVGFITKHRDTPFFLHMAHYAVHTPIQGKEDLVEKYTKKPKTNQKNATYAAMVESVDHAVGRIVQTLEELSLSAKTLVIFTSDNGGLTGPTNNKPLRAGKGYPYEGGIRIPQIVRWPGVVKAGSVCDTPVSSVDFLPTVCAAAGLNPPSDKPIDGESLMPLLQGNGFLKRDALFWHFPHYRGRDIVPYSIVRAGEWKLIRRYEGTRFELFNLANDIGEKKDLAESMPEKVRELDARLTAWLAATGAKLPRGNAAFDPAAKPPARRGREQSK